MTAAIGVALIGIEVIALLIFVSAHDALTLGQVRYLPLDVSASAIEQAVAKLTACYPAMLVDPIVGEFENAWDGRPRRTPRSQCDIREQER